MKNVVVIGGGHGLATILRGIKLIDDINIFAIVTVADDGGSTGRLRQRYNMPAVGDIRNVLMALSQSDEIMDELMNYRFEGSDNLDVSGHSLGNLILTALVQISGSFSKGIETLANVLNVKGKIIPSTLETVTLYAKMDDDTIVKGEANIPSLIHNIDKVYYDHKVKANEQAIKAILEADLIIYGIGSLYTSIIPNTIIKGISEALKESKAKKVYFANCMSQSNETYNYDLKQHVDALIQHGAYIDMVVKHNDKIPEDIIRKYSEHNSIEVLYNNNLDIPVKEYDMLVFDNKLVRHDTNKIKKVVEDLL